MKKRKRNIAKQIIRDLDELITTIKSGTPLHEKFTVRTVRIVPDPGQYKPADVQKLRSLLGVSQPVFARMLGVSAALVRSWECGQRKPSALARRLLDQMRANPANWRAMIEAA